MQPGDFFRFLASRIISLALLLFSLIPITVKSEESAAGKIYPACTAISLQCHPSLTAPAVGKDTAKLSIQAMTIASKAKSFDPYNNQFTTAILARFSTIYQRAHLETLALQQCLEHQLAGGKSDKCSVVKQLRKVIGENWGAMRTSYALGHASLWERFGVINTNTLKYTVPENNGIKSVPLTREEEQNALAQLKVVDDIKIQCQKRQLTYLNSCHGQVKDFLDRNFQPQQQKNYLDHLQKAPIMAYLTSSNPSDKELLAAVKKINKNRSDLLLKINSSNPPIENLMANQQVINHLLQDNPEYCPLADATVSAMARKNNAWMAVEIASAGASIVGCLASVLSVVGMELCALFIAADTTIFGKNLYDSIAQVDHTKTSIFSDALNNELIEDFYLLDEQEQAKALNALLFPLAAVGATGAISPMLNLSAKANRWVGKMRNSPKPLLKSPETDLALQRMVPEFDNTICLRGQCFSKGPQKVLDAKSELQHAGTLIGINDRDALAMVKKQIGERDGVYVYLLDKKGNLIISHRAPNLSLDASQEAYLATHRGLYNQLLKDLKLPVDSKHPIVAAGEMRVIGGKVRTVSDQAGSFHHSITEELLNTKKITIDPNDQKLIDELIALDKDPDPFAILDYLDENPQAAKFYQAARDKTEMDKKEKLEIVEEKLRTLQLISKEVKPATYAGAADSHYSAGQAAVFELQCRKNAYCGKILEIAREKNQSVLNHFSGDTRKIEEIGIVERQDGSYIADFISRPDMLIKEGGTEWLAQLKKDPAQFTKEDFERLSSQLEKWSKETLEAPPLPASGN